MPRHRLLVALAVAALAALLAEVPSGIAGADPQRSLLTSPVADAGPDQEVASLAAVTLDGSASVADPSASFTWSQTAGPTVVLSNPSDEMPTFVAPIGPATLTFELSITDGASSSADDITVAVRPLADFLDDAHFVTAQYQDFLGRAPTAAELQGHLDALASAATTRLQLVEDLLVSPAFTQPLEGAVQAYEAAFGRLPDRDGLRWWVAHRRAGASVSSLTDGLMDSHEYATHDGLMTDTQYVEHLYTDLLGRPADPSGLAYWTRQLADPATRTRYCTAACRRSARRRRRRVAISMGYSAPATLFLNPILLSEHADYAMLHTAPTASYVNQQLQAAHGGVSSALARLLLSPAYLYAHPY